MRRNTFIAVLLCAFALAACSNSAKEAKANLDAGEVFLAANAKKPGVVTLPSGLQYRIVKSGPATGGKPKLGDDIKVNYEGKTLDGQIFDSSFERGVPMARPLAKLVPGWLEILPMMRPGDEWEVFVPSKLGYGEEGNGPIPPNSVLIFRLQLIDFLPSPEGVAQG